MTVHQLEENEYNGYFETYINCVEGHDLNKGLVLNGEALVAFFKSIPEDKCDYKYAEGKWTIKEVLLHIIDTERIFAYRALRIARQDKTPLVGFEQDGYVAYYNCLNRTILSLINEYMVVRKATVALFESFDDVALKSMGVASSHPISVRAIGFIVVGHENHHIKIIKERYL